MFEDRFAHKNQVNMGAVLFCIICLLTRLYNYLVTKTVRDFDLIYSIYIKILKSLEVFI